MSIIDMSAITAFAAYAVGTACPGPGIMSIVAISVESGRRAGLFQALGIMVGSQIWGLGAVSGLARLVSAYPGSPHIIELGAGLVLLWLGCKGMKLNFAMKRRATGIEPIPRTIGQMKVHFCRGLMINLINPKAVLVW
ncbi:MAG: LysE family transporter, partial [Acidocella sp.]|nr:LysE family transporter [Acidocella sp.]